jgi:hypothetical protein
MATYCYICSAARSGSTLLDMLIGGHSTAASLGEFSFLGKSIAMGEKCSCGKLITTCPQWSKIFSQILTDRGIDLLKSPYALWQWDTLASVKIDHKQQTNFYLALRKVRTIWCDMHYLCRINKKKIFPLPPSLQKSLANISYLYDLIACQWNKDVIVDSSKNIHKTLAVYEKNPLTTKIIFLTRDGRGVYYSRRSSGFSQRQSITGWYRYNRRAASLLNKTIQPNHLLHIKYENLAENPEKTMQTVCSFLEIAYEPSMIELGQAKRHLVSGNDTRFKKNQTIKLDDRWLTRLKGEELSYFQSKGGLLNSTLGYH